MWKITTVIFLITTIICAYKWFAAKIGLDILVDYAIKKGYIPPSENELAECTENVQNRILKRISKKKDGEKC